MSATTSAVDKSGDSGEDVARDTQPLLHKDHGTPRKRSRCWYDLQLYNISCTSAALNRCALVLKQMFFLLPSLQWFAARCEKVDMTPHLCLLTCFVPFCR